MSFPAVIILRCPCESSFNLSHVLVLVHGLDSAKDTWTAVVADMSNANYPTIALDLRGHGESPLGDINDFSVSNMAADVREAVNRHGTSSPVVLVVKSSLHKS